MKNPYKPLIEQGKLGALAKILDLPSLKMKKTTEDNRLRVYGEFILENMTSETMTGEEFIRSLHLLEKALAGEINGKHFINENTGSMFQAIGGTSHYEVRVLHGLQNLGMIYAPDMVLTKSLIKKLIGVPWDERIKILLYL